MSGQKLGCFFIDSAEYNILIQCMFYKLFAKNVIQNLKSFFATATCEYENGNEGMLSLVSFVYFPGMDLFFLFLKKNSGN